jgi:hypothetical protein
MEALICALLLESGIYNLDKKNVARPHSFPNTRPGRSRAIFRRLHNYFGGYTSQRVGVDNAVWDLEATQLCGGYTTLEATRHLEYFRMPQDLQSNRWCGAVQLRWRWVSLWPGLRSCEWEWDGRSLVPGCPHPPHATDRLPLNITNHNCTTSSC